jgi:hypothetical protein
LKVCSVSTNQSIVNGHYKSLNMRGPAISRNSTFVAMDAKQLLLILLFFIVISVGWRVVGGAVRAVGQRGTRRRQRELEEQRLQLADQELSAQIYDDFKRRQDGL